VRRSIERITAPTLLLWGTGDRVIPRALIDELVSLHPEWAFQAIDGIGHMLPWEAPDTRRRSESRPRQAQIEAQNNPSRRGAAATSRRTTPRIGPRTILDR
jgi:pimeloyl-ACP methyl ester carboxylesterase